MALSWIFILALLLLGNIAAKKIKFFQSLNFPGSLVGGMLGGLLMLVMRRGFSTTIEIPAEPRDLLLVIFFICSGLVMTISSWKEAGRSLISLSAICALFIVIQNVVGILTVLTFGQHPVLGVMSGSVAYVGGLGSAVAWGREAASQGITGAVEVGVVASTLGLLISALISGPYVAFVIKRDKIKGPIESEGELGSPAVVAKLAAREERRFTESEFVAGLLLISLSLLVGDQIGSFVAGYNMTFPRFLSAMIAGVLISMGMEQANLTVNRALVDKIGSICLNVFIVMTLSGIEFSKLEGAVGSILVVALVQTVVSIIAIHFLIYRWLGRGYESLAIAGGFVGFILGSFAIAMATVRNTESRFGPSPRAVLLVTLVGGAVCNLANALIILAFFKVLF